VPAPISMDLRLRIVRAVACELGSERRVGQTSRSRACVEQILAPALEPGDVVVLDNLAAHKVDGVRQALAAAGAALLFLPPYSPDLNPIEQLFAKLQALLRHIAAQTKDELWEAIGRLLVTVPVSECVTTSTHCCYSSI
jgi:transposase